MSRRYLLRLVVISRVAFAVAAPPHLVFDVSADLDLENLQTATDADDWCHFAKLMSDFLEYLSGARQRQRERAGG